MYSNCKETHATHKWGNSIYFNSSEIILIIIFMSTVSMAMTVTAGDVHMAQGNDL